MTTTKHLEAAINSLLAALYEETSEPFTLTYGGLEINFNEGEPIDLVHIIHAEEGSVRLYWKPEEDEDEDPQTLDMGRPWRDQVDED